MGYFSGTCGRSSDRFFDPSAEIPKAEEKAWRSCVGTSGRTASIEIGLTFLEALLKSEACFFVKSACRTRGPWRVRLIFPAS
jgi:hypothetical protein